MLAATGLSLRISGWGEMICDLGMGTMENGVEWVETMIQLAKDVGRQSLWFGPQCQINAAELMASSRMNGYRVHWKDIGFKVTW